MAWDKTLAAFTFTEVVRAETIKFKSEYKRIYDKIQKQSSYM